MSNPSNLRLFHGEALFRPGQKATHFYLVQRGTILVLDQAGHAVRRHFGANDLFGIPEVLAHGLWDLTAVANGETVVRLFAADALFRTLAEMPAEHDRFLRGIASMA